MSLFGKNFLNFHFKVDCSDHYKLDLSLWKEETGVLDNDQESVKFCHMEGQIVKAGEEKRVRACTKCYCSKDKDKSYCHSPVSNAYLQFDNFFFFSTEKLDLLSFWMGDDAARQRSALRGVEPCRVMTHHNKSLLFRLINWEIVGKWSTKLALKLFSPTKLARLCVVTSYPIY